MERTNKPDKNVLWPPHCPECGSVFEVRLVEIKAEAVDKGELLLLLDCPRNDFYATLTPHDLAVVLAAGWQSP